MTKFKLKKWRKDAYLRMKSNPEEWAKYKARVNQFSKTPKGVYNTIKRNSKVHKRNFDLDQEDFLKWYASSERKCFYCGIHEEKIKKVKNKHGLIIGRLTIDRVENEKGYTLDNIVLACDLCNQVKGALLSKADMIKIGELIIRPKWESRTPL